MGAGGKVLNRTLHRIECGLLGAGSGPLRYPPVFILGAPRCGSTLLYQAMLDYFRLGYISNFHCKFFGAPSLAERAFRLRGWREASSYRSDHGHVSGWGAPSECGSYWYRFFRRKPQYVPLNEAPEGCLGDLRRSLRAIGAAMGRSVLFKNLLTALRLEPVLMAVPESIFIVVQRDWLDTAHSLLESRMKLHGDYGRWFSVEPPEIDSLRERPAHEQVVEQIRSIHALIDKERRPAPDRFMDVDYDLFCRDTHAVLERIGEFLKLRGVALRAAGEVPCSFTVRKSIRIDEGLYKDLEDYVERTARRGM